MDAMWTLDVRTKPEILLVPFEIASSRFGNGDYRVNFHALFFLIQYSISCFTSNLR